MPPPAKPQQAPPPASSAAPAGKPGRFSLSAPRAVSGQRIGIYGGGGIGKTSLACRAPGPVAIFDFDHSLPVLKPTLEGLDLRVADGVETFADLREALHDGELWQGVKTIVIDSLTRCEQLAIAHTLATVAHEKGGKVTSIEGYGFGKGYRHVAETMLLLLSDLDAHVRAGRNICLIMHDCTENVPNPEGVDYIRWAPRLQAQANGNVRLAVQEWLDHLFCVRMDVNASKDRNESGKGKATGGETRTIYPQACAVHMAKSRSLREPFEYADGSAELWNRLFDTKGK